MNLDFSLFLAALGLSCVLEAIPWIISPARMLESIRQLAALGEDRLRICAAIILAGGVFLCALAKHL